LPKCHSHALVQPDARKMYYRVINGEIN
jgi:hypothetical protein